MATVTGLTAERMLEIEAASVVDGDIDGDNLILTKHDGSQINAGNVRGPVGPAGPPSSDLVVVTAQAVLDVGILDQIRSGRQLTAADFTNMGLSAPTGLWNLSDLTDVSGNGRALLNKGVVPFDGVGINGIAATAARFSGSVAQALYIADSGAADPFRILNGSWGCWFKTAKRGVNQWMMAKIAVAGAASDVWLGLFISAGNVAAGQTFAGGALSQAVGSSDIADNRWHFVVCTCDGARASVYVDGVLEGSVSAAGAMTSTGIGPFNIGGYAADGATNNQGPFFGRVDEAFVCNDVLSEEHVRNLYCAKVAHTLGVPPTRVTLNVRRRRRGAALVVGDFATQPVRLHNFSAGSLGDEGSGAVALTNNGAALSISGADGTAKNAFNFSGTQSLTSTDVGMPLALTSRSWGCWFKTSSLGAALGIMGWASGAAVQRALLLSGALRVDSGADLITGPFVADGIWHQMVIVEDNAATDGVKRKVYLDGRFVAGSTVMNSLASGGANAFAVGKDGLPGNFFIGQIDGVFVNNYALSADEVYKLYAKGSLALTSSPKNAGDHVEAMNSTHLLVAFDTLESSSQVDLGVAA